MTLGMTWRGERS